MQAGTTRSLYHVELGVCTFSEMRYNTECWLLKRFLTQSMEAYEFGVMLGFSSETEAAWFKAKATGITFVLIKQMMKILYCKKLIKAKAPR